MLKVKSCPVTQVQLMKPGIASCAAGGFPFMETCSLVPRPHPKIGKGAWCYLQTFPYVLCQQSSFGVEESRSSIANYNIPSSII